MTALTADRVRRELSLHEEIVHATIEIHVRDDAAAIASLKVMPGLWP